MLKKIKHPIEKLIFLVGIVIYSLILRLFGSTCIILSIFGVRCPGCGLTRAVLSLLRLDFAAAVDYHPLVFTLPLLFLYFLFDGRLFSKIADRIILSVVLAAFVFVWVMRLIGYL